MTEEWSESEEENQRTGQRSHIKRNQVNQISKKSDTILNVYTTRDEVG